MSTVRVPRQPHHADGPAAPEDASVPPHASEATRLLCGGVYVDPDYRDRVIDELYLHEQRLVAPSLGFDAARVLAHALRARRQEPLTAVRELRADQARLRQSEQTARLDEAPADTEEEIDRAGTAGEDRRRRLRDLLADAETLTVLLASAGTVAGLLGM